MVEISDQNFEAQLSERRTEIDIIDQQLVELLNRRAAIAIEIGQLKIAAHKPVHDPMREVEIVTNVIKANNGPLKDESLRHVFSVILRVDKNAQSGQSLQEDPKIVDAPRRGYGWRTGGSW